MSVKGILHDQFEKLFHRDRDRRKPVNPNDKHQSLLTLQDKLAIAVTNALGTMLAVYVFVIFMAIWIITQFFVHPRPFDPYPFTFLICITSIAQMILMPLIMVGQNIQSRHTEHLSEEQYHTMLLAYEDIEHVLQHLTAQDKELIAQRKMLEQVLDKLGVAHGAVDDKELQLCMQNHGHPEHHSQDQI
jgi:uncharacterized membrane protein